MSNFFPTLIIVFTKLSGESVLGMSFQWNIVASLSKNEYSGVKRYAKTARNSCSCNFQCNFELIVKQYKCKSVLGLTMLYKTDCTPFTEYILKNDFVVFRMSWIYRTFYFIFLLASVYSGKLTYKCCDLHTAYSNSCRRGEN